MLTATDRLGVAAAGSAAREREATATAASGATLPRIRLSIISEDPAVVDALSEAAPAGVQAASAPSLAASQLAAWSPDVLVVDLTDVEDIAGVVDAAVSRFPHAVVIAVGARENSVELMQFTAAAVIFRFLLHPLGAGQVRLALGAAIAHHGERTMRAKDEGVHSAEKSPRRPRLIIGAALVAAVLAALGGGWLAVTRTNDAPPSAAPAQTPATPEREAPQLEATLAAAETAFAAGRLLEPQGESALDLYRSVLVLQPGDERALTGIDAIVNATLASAEAAILDGRLEEASRLSELARGIDAQHTRLAFLDVQIARERERVRLAQELEVDRRARQQTVKPKSASASASALELQASSGSASTSPAPPPSAARPAKASHSEPPSSKPAVAMPDEHPVADLTAATQAAIPASPLKV